MRGPDVCAHLAGDPRTARTSILVMSARNENVRELFRGFSSVVDFIGKPFSAEDIVACANRLVPPVAHAPIDDAPKAVASSLLPFSFAQKEAAAQAIYKRLSGQLARIPELIKGLGHAAPGPFFARKLLTATTMDELDSMRWCPS